MAVQHARGPDGRAACSSGGAGRWGPSEQCRSVAAGDGGPTTGAGCPHRSCCGPRAGGPARKQPFGCRRRDRRRTHDGHRAAGSCNRGPAAPGRDCGGRKSGAAGGRGEWRPWHGFCDVFGVRAPYAERPTGGGSSGYQQRLCRPCGRGIHASSGARCELIPGSVGRPWYVWYATGGQATRVGRQQRA